MYMLPLDTSDSLPVLRKVRAPKTSICTQMHGDAMCGNSDSCSRIANPISKTVN